MIYIVLAKYMGDPYVEPAPRDLVYFLDTKPFHPKTGKLLDAYCLPDYRLLYYGKFTDLDTALTYVDVYENTYKIPEEDYAEHAVPGMVNVQGLGDFDPRHALRPEDFLGASGIELARAYNINTNTSDHTLEVLAKVLFADKPKNSVRGGVKALTKTLKDARRALWNTE